MPGQVYESTGGKHEADSAFLKKWLPSLVKLGRKMKGDTQINKKDLNLRLNLCVSVSWVGNEGITG